MMGEKTERARAREMMNEEKMTIKKRKGRVCAYVYIYMYVCMYM